MEISNTLKKLLKKREISPSDFENLISWDLKTLPNLFSNLKDIKRAATRILEAVKNNEQIGIYGDYDADGTTSCALLYHFFRLFNIEVKLFQPARFSEGYGLHKHSIDNAINENVNLLITVDCGITNGEAAEYALTQKNFTLIITDHHADILDELPKAYAVINPNRKDEIKSELQSLAGVGVAFALANEIRNLRGDLPSIYPLLQFVAIGTIADVAPLTPLNLKLVRHGLMLMKNTSYEGISKFISNDERKIENQKMVPSNKISFEIAPMINSKGRLEHPEQALKLLTSLNSIDAQNHHSSLEISNRERKFVQAEIFEQAKQQILQQINYHEMAVNVAYNPSWHEGVIGIVASKLVDTFEIPAIVGTNSEEKDIIKFSARTAGELDLFYSLKQCEDLFIKFGGHRAAAGFSIHKDNLNEFKNKISKIIEGHPFIERTIQNHYDIEIDFDEIDLQFIKELELLEPYGNGNPKPVFRMNNFVIDSFDIFKDKHVRWYLSSKKNPQLHLRGISFNFIGKWNEKTPSELFNLQKETSLTAQFTLEINKFNNNEFIQLTIDKFV